MLPMHWQLLYAQHGNLKYMVSMSLIIFFGMWQSFCAANNSLDLSTQLIPYKENSQLIASLREAIFQQDIKMITKELKNMQLTDISLERLEGFLMLSQYQRSQITDSEPLAYCFLPFMGVITFIIPMGVLLYQPGQLSSLLDFFHFVAIPIIGAFGTLYISHLHDSNYTKKISKSIIQEFQDKLLEHRRLLSERN